MFLRVKDSRIIIPFLGQKISNISSHQALTYDEQMYIYTYIYILYVPTWALVMLYQFSIDYRLKAINKGLRITKKYDML